MDDEKEGSPTDSGQGPVTGEGSRGPDLAGNDAGDGNPELANHPLRFKLAVYDGPLDLLLELIKKNEMDIYNIPIAEITRQYLEQLATMKKLDLEIAGEYLVLAATLVYIKSRTLLPQDNTDEDDDGLDPREELVRKLLEYQAFKEAAKELGMLEDERGQIFTRQITDYYLKDISPEDIGIDTFSANLYDLLSAFQNVLTRSGRKQLHEVFEEVVSIEEKMAEVKQLLLTNEKIRFSDLFKTYWSRNLLIVTFLALLELVRTKTATFRQDKQFGEIVIQRCRGGQTPAAPLERDISETRS